MLIEIPEEMILDASKVMDNLEEDEKNNFSKVLENGSAIKETGLTPMYLYDPYEHGIYVVIKETYGKKLH